MQSIDTVDPFLVVGMSILIFIMLIINVYILVYWQHPEDRNQSYLAKLLIIFGLQLSAVSVLMLPVDVANNAGDPHCDPESTLSASNAYCGGIDMFNLWGSMFCMVCFTVVILIPFATFYYESDATDLTLDMNKRSRFWPALFQESVVVLTFLLILLALYFTKSRTELPVSELAFPISEVMNVTYTMAPGDSSYVFLEQTLPAEAFISQLPVVRDTEISLPVTFPVYLIGLFGWLGWWLFAVFAGVGLASMPFDLICAYIWRPRLLAPDEMATIELELQDRTNEILEVTHMLKRERTQAAEGAKSKANLRRRFVSDRIEVSRLSQMVFMLERDLDEFRACKTVTNGYNPLIPIAKLGAGLFVAVVSVLWILQIILAILTKPAASPFLSLYLISFDAWFPMFGNLTYALLSLYLLVCTVKGCFKISVRFLCIKVHPMEVNGTFVSSFLFNLGIVLLCTIPLVHFCVVAFEGYTVNTDAFLLFAVQVQNLHFYSIFYVNNVFIWIIMLSALSVLPYFFIRPRDVATTTEDFKKHLAERAVRNAGSEGEKVSLKDLKGGKKRGGGRKASDTKGDVEMGKINSGGRGQWKGSIM